MTEKICYQLTYSKKDRIKYISHLDMVNVFDRAMRRCKFPVYYTEGFNPRIKISFNKAHAVGAEVASDTCKVYFLQECAPSTIAQKLNEALPKGITIDHVEKT